MGELGFRKGPGGGVVVVCGGCRRTRAVGGHRGVGEPIPSVGPLRYGHPATARRKPVPKSTEYAAAPAGRSHPISGTASPKTSAALKKVPTTWGQVASR